MKQLYKVELSFRKQSFIYYVYAKSDCHAFKLVLRQLKSIYPDFKYMSDISNKYVSVVLNFLK